MRGRTVFFSSFCNLGLSLAGSLAFSSTAFAAQTQVLLKGIVLAKDKEDLLAANIIPFEGVKFASVEIPGKSAALTKKLSTLFLNQQITPELLLEIKKEIIAHFKAAHRPLVLVEIPQQDITHGRIGFIVTEASVGDLNFKGNRWFSNDQLKKNVRLKKGGTVDEDKLLNDLAWLNRNPFHQTEAILAPGQRVATTNIDLVTRDRLPWRFYVGGDNTGNDFTGNARFYAGFTWGNAFWMQDLLSYQFTTSEDFHKFISHFATYTSFLPWRHILTFYGGYARIHPKIKDFRSTGHNIQGSMRYAIPFKPYYKPLTQEVTWGFDYKNTNTNLFFIGDLDNVPVVTKEVNLTQLYLGYTLEDKKKHNELVFNLEGFYSPGEWLPHQTNQDYNNLRAHAKNRYFYAHLSIKDVAKFKHHLSLAALLRLQGATGTLLPSETFGLGGYDTVRGYDEREVIADNALCANLELRYNVKKFTFLVFSDYGLGYNYHPLSGQHKIEQLVSVGPGLRYIYSPYITARLDYGFQLHHTDLGENQFGKFHVGLVLSY